MWEARLTLVSIQTLADHIPACSSTQAKTPAIKNAHLQGQAGSPNWPESMAGSSAWFGPLVNGPYYHSTLQESKFTALLNC